MSPSINIGIGEYGIRCVEELAKTFTLREDKVYRSYISFHQLNKVDGMIDTYSYKNNEFIKDVIYDLDDFDDINYRLSNYINKAYGELINFAKLADNPIGFTSININLIFSTFENEHLELLKEFIIVTDKLKEQGTIGAIRIKCFSILSEGKQLATKIEEAIIGETLDMLLALKKNYNILSHIFVLDDKNTKAVSLHTDERFIGFVLNEFIVALLENENTILGPLHSPNGVFSLGLGAVLFDKPYFQSYLKHEVIKSRIWHEKIVRDDVKISMGEYRNAVNETLKPFTSNSKSIEDLTVEIERVSSYENFSGTISCYEFLLTNLLGLHDVIRLKEPIDKKDVYSIDDIIYWSLYNSVLSKEEKEEGGGYLELEEFKRRSSEFDILQIDKDNEYDDSRKQTLDEQLFVLDEQLRKHEISVKSLINRYSNKGIRTNAKITSEKIDSYDTKIESVKKEKDSLEVELDNLGLFKRWCKGRRYKDKINEKTNEVNLLESQKQQEEKEYSANNAKLRADLDKLYKLKENLQNKYNKLQSGKRKILSLRDDYKENLDSIPYLDFEFIYNIINQRVLDEYIKAHDDQLQNNIQNTLSILFKDTKNRKEEFDFILNEKISTTVNSVIDFKMIDYLFGKYDELNLFRKFDFDTDINALKQRVFAFVNVIPTYSHQSHSLKSIKHINENSKNALAKKLEGNFSAGIPAYIPMRSNDKFIFYTIERIDSLRDIVKYNNHFGRIIKEKV